MLDFNWEFIQGLDGTIIATCYDNRTDIKKKGIEVGIIFIEKDDTVTVMPNDFKISLEDYHLIKNNMFRAFIYFTGKSKIEKTGQNFKVEGIHQVLEEYLNIEREMII